MDEAMLRAVNGWAEAPAVAAYGNFVSSPTMVVLICTPLALYLLYRRRFLAVLSIALSMGAGDLLSSRILKPAFDRERPCRDLEGLVPVASCGVGRSYPSSHATVSFAFYVSAAGTIPYGWAILLPPTLAVATSRVLLGVHYPSDVAGGAVVGSLIGAGMIRLRRRTKRRRDGASEDERG